MFPVFEQKAAVIRAGEPELELELEPEPDVFLFLGAEARAARKPGA